MEKKIEVLENEVSSLKERLAGLEKAYVQLDASYNKHIADLHVRKIDQQQQQVQQR